MSYQLELVKISIQNSNALVSTLGLFQIANRVPILHLICIDTRKRSQF
jgi:hypothetical protein